jgi:hypothetical protein
MVFAKPKLTDETTDEEPEHAAVDSTVEGAHVVQDYRRVDDRQLSPSLSDQIEWDRRKKAHDEGKVYPLITRAWAKDLAGKSTISNGLV